MDTTTGPSHEGLREFLGLLGYASLGSFALLAEDAAHAPDIRSRLGQRRPVAREWILRPENLVLVSPLGDETVVLVELARVGLDGLVLEVREQVRRLHLQWNIEAGAVLPDQRRL